MAVYKDIPRFDGSGITEYYRVNTGEIVKLSSDYDSLEDKPSINGIVLEGDLTTADLNIPLGDLAQLKTEIKDNIVNAINELHLEATDFEQSITNKVNSIISFTIVWVEKLPEAKDAHHNTVYLVPKTSMAEEGNYCEEYLYTDHGWEKIGDTKVDLSGYYTKTEVDTITNELTEQVDTILEDYATKEELENRASALEEQVDTILEDYATKEELNDLEEQVDTILEDYATVEYVQSLALFESITPPAQGEIYCVNDGEMKVETFYEIPRGVKVGYRDGDGVAKAFGGTINSSYLNKYRALSIWTMALTGTNYGTLISEASANGSWVYNPGLGVSKTGHVSNLASAGNFGTVSSYLTTRNVATTLPTTYASFDTQVLSGNVGYKIGQRLNALEAFQEDVEQLHEVLNSPAYYEIEYQADDLIPNPDTYMTFTGIPELGDYFTVSEDGTIYTGTSTTAYQTISMSITVDKDYTNLPLTIEAYKYSSSYYPSVLLNGEVYYGSGSGSNGNMTYSLTFTSLKAGDVITLKYGARYANHTYVATFGLAYQKMIRPYEQQTLKQLANFIPFHNPGLDTIKYNRYNNKMEYQDAVLFNHWQPVRYLEPFSYTIENKSTTYGFFLDEEDGYYKSNSTAERKNYAVCKVSFNLPEPSDISISYMNSGGYYQYGLFSNIDRSLTLSSTADSNNVYLSCYGRLMTDFDTLVYKDVPAGEHYFYVKFVQTNSTVSPSGENRLYFKVTQENTLISELTETIVGEHYELYSDNQDSTVNHSLIFDYFYNEKETDNLSIINLDTDVHSYVIQGKDYATLEKILLAPMQQWYKDYLDGRFTPMVVTTQVREASWKYRDFVLRHLSVHPDATWKRLYFEAYDSDSNGIFTKYIWSIRLDTSGRDVVSLSFNLNNGYIDVDKYTDINSANIGSYLNSYATKTYVDEKVANIVSFGVELVDALPTEDISTSTVYMVPSDKTEEQNVKDEYLYTENGWEMIGTTKVDLSDYYNKTEVDTLVANAEGNIQAAKDYTDERIDALYLHCSEVEYNALTQQERDSFLVAIVDDMAESGEDVETLLQEILMDENPTETEDDMTEDEAMAILDEIIEGGV